jgi:hypothetical protein
MELLLNLIWVALAIGSFVVFTRRHQLTSDGTVYWRSLLTLACVLLLLFPIISASDDLHPTQALMEEATKRVLHLASPAALPNRQLSSSHVADAAAARIAARAGEVAAPNTTRV